MSIPAAFPDRSLRRVKKLFWGYTMGWHTLYGDACIRKEGAAIMNDTQKLLCKIYKNAEMGVRTLPPLMKKADNASFIKALENRLEQYTQIRDEAGAMLRDSGYDKPLGLSGMEKASTDSMLHLNMMRDDSCAHFADMIIKGGAMGVTDMAKQLEDCRSASDTARTLAQRLSDLEQKGIEEMTPYLGAVTNG